MQVDGEYLDYEDVETEVVYNLCRAIYVDEDGEEQPIRFSICLKHLRVLFSELYAEKYDNDISLFVDTYEPEVEGQEIFLRARTRGWIVKDYIDVFGRLEM